MVKVVGEPSANCVGTTRDIVNDAGGKRSLETDEEGRQTSYSYHPDGRLLQVVRAYGTADAVTTTLAWHAAHDVPTRIAEPGLTTDFAYDGGGRLTSVVQTDTTTHTLPYSTACQSRAWALTYTQQNLLDTVDGLLPGAGDLVDYDYDANGYLTQVTDELGHVTDIVSVNGRGQPTRILDPNGLRMDLAYDALGRLTASTAFVGAAQRVTAFEYDGVGQITKATLPDGSHLAYTYDAARRLTAIANEAGERVEFAHDLMGNITRREVKNGAGGIVETHSKTLRRTGSPAVLDRRLGADLDTGL